MSKIVVRQRRFPRTGEGCKITGELVREQAHLLDRCLNADVTWEMSGTYSEYEVRLIADVPRDAVEPYIRSLMGDAMECIKVKAGDEMPEDTNI